MSTPDWVLDREIVQYFGSILVAADVLDTPHLVLDYFEKPHKWDPEFQLWDACNRPESGEIVGWDWFVAKLAKAVL
jgi:hypothetical protein